MGKYTALDKRMKRYEASSDICLTRRTPVVLRFEMCHGHTFAKGFDKPFDVIFMYSMQKTMQCLCESIQGAVFGYTQSDEITIVLCDYKRLDTDAWFDYRLEKMCSVGASMASRFFNKYFMEAVEKLNSARTSNELNKIFRGIFKASSMSDMFKDTEIPDISKVPYDTYKRRYFTADFDCRAFNIPKEEVCNCVIWRQNDAEKNSVQTLAQSMYSQKELNGIKTNQLQDKMFTEKGINWNELETACKRGTACKKNSEGAWEVDYEMPIVKKNREYVEDLVYCKED